MQGIKNLTQGPINRQLFNLAMPIMATSFIQMAYSLTDMAWVGRLGSEAVAAIGSVGILTWMSGSISLLNKVGSEVSVGQSIGAQSQEDARSFASHNITIALIISICWGTLLFIFAEPIIRIYELEDHITANAIQYLRIISTGLPFIFLSAAFTGIYNAAGRSKVPFFISGTGLILNIILDPIFIFGYCGETLSGTTGAAVATVIGQFCGAGMTLYFNTRKNPDIQISFKGFRPSAKAIGRIYTVGLPSIAMQCVGSLMTFGMNLILMAFSATAVAVFGVYFKLQSFVFMPIFGLNNGMVPIISYNYGARRPDRVKKTIKLAVCYAEGIMLAGFCIFQFAPRQVLSIFAASDAMLAIGIPAMRIICLHFLLAGVSIVLSSVFQALGNGVFSLIVSVCRQLFVLLPAAWLLAQTGNVNNVWWAFLIAEVVSILMSLAFYARINKTTIAPLYR